MADVRDLKQKRGEIAAQANALLNTARAASRSLNHAEQASFDRLMADQADLAATIEREERGASLDRELSTTAGRQTTSAVSDSWSGDPRNRHEGDLAFRAWALGPRATTEMRAAADKAGIDVASPEINLRALSVGTASSGGYGVSASPIGHFERIEKYFGPMRRLARVIETPTGAGLPVPRFSDVHNMGEIVNEASAITVDVDPLYSNVTLLPKKYSSSAVYVSMELLQDSAIPLAETLFEALAERLARVQNLHFTVGAGGTVPQGAATGATLGATSSSTNAITFDDVINLTSSLDPSYASRDDVAFQMHPSTAAALRKVRAEGTQGQYMWEMSLQAGSPATADSKGQAGRILGYPVYLNPDMDQATSTGKRVVLFGAWRSSYTVQDAGGVVLRRSDDLRLLNAQSVFVAFRRSDGAVTNPNGLVYLRTL